MSGRDWARLGHLYLQDGVWNGERILPEGYAKFVSTLAPPRLLLDQRGRHVPGPEGGVLHVRRGRPDHADHSAHDLVVARLGHFKGSTVGSTGFRKALALLMDAVPQKKK
jgi:CubicO group peptidase (beta-lactamase class C family)